MSRQIKRMLALLGALALLFCAAPAAGATPSEQLPAAQQTGEGAAEETPALLDSPAPDPLEESPEDPPEDPEADLVTDAQQLQDWLESHSGSGGEVLLGGSITLEAPITIYGNPAEIVINTGRYGLVFNGGSLSMDCVQLIGEGVDTPVLTVVSAYPVPRFALSWVHAVQPLSVTATGREGQGGTAVHIAQDDGKLPAGELFLNEGRIRSFGEGAVGLSLAAPVEAWCLRVEVEGAASTAVLAPEGAVLRFCRLTAEGEGAAAARGGALVLDSCSAAPQPQGEGFSVEQRRIVDTAGRALYLPLRQHEPHLDWAIGPYYNMTYLLGDGAGDPQPLALLTTWDPAAIQALDVAVPGRLTVQGQLPLPFRGLGLEEDFPLTLTIDVRDPDTPCISGIEAASSADEGSFLRFTLWKSDRWGPEDLLLWRSDDLGDSWRDVAGDPAVRVNTTEDAHIVLLFYDDLTAPIQFQAEVAGFGESNVATISQKDGNIRTDPGGDRTGTDRNGATKPEDRDPPGGGVKLPVNDGRRPGGSSGRQTQQPAPEQTQPTDPTAATAPPLELELGTPVLFVPVDAEQPRTDVATPPEQAQAISAPAPAPPPTTAPQPEPPQEIRTETMTALSGERLAGLIASNAQSVTFVLGATRVIVDTQELEALALESHQLFTVLLEPENEAPVRFLVDGVELSLPHRLQQPEAEPAAPQPTQPAPTAPPTLPTAPENGTGAPDGAVLALSGITVIAAAGGITLVRRRRAGR